MLNSVAVMQPYFFPYGGYFSLMSSVDHFILFDCVQFPRRGWVHRNRVINASGAEEWLTLPLGRQPRDVAIRDLSFASDAGVRLALLYSRYPWVAAAKGKAGALIRDTLLKPPPSPIELLAATLSRTAELLDIRPTFSFSSELKLDPELRGQARVIACVKAVGGRRYVNAVGGIGLYEVGDFRHQGLEIEFLDPYLGSKLSMFYRLAVDEVGEISREISHNSKRSQR